MTLKVNISCRYRPHKTNYFCSINHDLEGIKYLNKDSCNFPSVHSVQVIVYKRNKPTEKCQTRESNEKFFKSITREMISCSYGSKGPPLPPTLLPKGSRPCQTSKRIRR